jgi:hypothetical protein
MFLLSNVAGVFNLIAYPEYFKDTSNHIWLGAASFSVATNWGLANIAHWEFSFEYYNMVRIIPFVLDALPPLQSIIYQNTAQFWIWIVLNTMAAVAIGVSTYFGEITGRRKNSEISYLTLTLLEFISLIYLGLSIYRIRKMTKEKEIKINTKLMIVHALTVIISLLSLFIWIFVFTVNLDESFYFGT